MAEDSTTSARRDWATGWERQWQRDGGWERAGGARKKGRCGMALGSAMWVPGDKVRLLHRETTGWVAEATVGVGMHRVSHLLHELLKISGSDNAHHRVPLTCNLAALLLPPHSNTKPAS